jgi:hypothetical protein
MGSKWYRSAMLSKGKHYKQERKVSDLERPLDKGWGVAPW